MRRRGAAVYGVLICGCSSSARTIQEASDSETDWEQSTAYLYCDVVSQNRLPSKQAQGMKWSEVGAVGGVYRIIVRPLLSLSKIKFFKSL